MPKRENGNVTLVPVQHPTFWGELSQTEQKTLVKETEGFLKEIETMRKSRTRAVLHLMNLRNLLLAKGHFHKYVQGLAHSARSSYRWLNRANELELPAPVLEAAADRGIDLIHASYINPIKELPPPKTLAALESDDPKVIHYVERVEALRGSGASNKPVIHAEDAEKVAWRAVMREYKRMGSRARGPWGLRLLGRLMHAMSIPAQRLEPEVPPEDFAPKAGYPKGRPRS